jgi:hypothetical protein
LTDAGTKVTDVSIGRYEADEPKGREPALGYVKALAAFSGVSLMWLVTGDGDPHAATPGEAQWRLQRVREALDAPLPPPTEPGAGKPPGDAAEIAKRGPDIRRA